MMSVLEKLKIVAITPKRALSVEQERRNKLARKLEEQLKLAEAKLGGPITSSVLTFSSNQTPVAQVRAAGQCTCPHRDNFVAGYGLFPDLQRADIVNDSENMRFDRPLGSVNLRFSRIFPEWLCRELFGAILVSPDRHLTSSVRSNRLTTVNDVVHFLERESPSVPLRKPREIGRRNLEHLADHTVTLPCGPVACGAAQSKLRLPDFRLLGLGTRRQE
jgi:hypothetical protein